MTAFRETPHSFFGWLGARWEEVRSAPALLWKWTEGSSMFRGIAIALTVAVAALLLYLIISFFRVSWKGKLRQLLLTAVAFLAFCALLVVAKREVERFQLPEAQALQLGGEEFVSYPQYSLMHGMPTFGGESTDWVISDPVFTVRSGEDRILQLTGLDQLCSTERYYLDAMKQTDDRLHLHFSRSVNDKPDEAHAQTTSFELDILLLQDRELRQLPWYLEEGQTITGKHIRDDDGLVHYDIRENSGDRLIFSMHDEWGRLPAFGIARQIGPDVLIGLSQGFINRWEDRVDWSGNNPVMAEHFDLDPDTEADAELLAEPLLVFFDGHVHLSRGLTEEEQRMVLPGRVADFPPGETSYKNGGFAFPCRQLLEMVEEPEYSGTLILRFLGDGPDGEPCVYTLLNGGNLALRQGLYENGAPWYAEWDAAFEAGCQNPDEAMTAFLGAPAVAYEDGWLLNPGTFMGVRSPEPDYYFLTLEPQEAGPA